MTQEEVLRKYDLDPDLLDRLFNSIVEFVQIKGATVKYASLEDIVEVDIYKIDKAIRNIDVHHETCVCDGKEIWMHDDLGDTGGITGRLYDLLHVGCGHLWQWSAGESSRLEFHGDAAWAVGSKPHLGADERRLASVKRYEREAGELALANLRVILAEYGFDVGFSTTFLQFFTDYLNTDLEYIIAYYQWGTVENFFDQWIYQSTPLNSIYADFPLAIKQRPSKCIALLTKRN